MGNLGLTFELKDSHRTLEFMNSCFHLRAHSQIHTSKILTSILGSLRDPVFTLRLVSLVITLISLPSWGLDSH